MNWIYQKKKKSLWLQADHIKLTKQISKNIR